MSDQAQQASNNVESVSPEVADYFGVQGKNQATETTGSEKVTSDGGEKKTANADTTKENNSESNASKSKEVTENKKTTVTKDSKVEDIKNNAQPNGYEVAGTKYDTLEKAIEAVNRINGDNTRLVGENKSIKADKIKLDSKVEELEKSLEQYRKANEDWKRYYEDGGEKPDVTLAEIDEKIKKEVKSIKQSEENIAKKIQFDSELDEIFKDPDFEETKDTFMELIDEIDGVPKISPLKLYERAKKIARKENTSKEDKDIEEMIEERANKKLAQREAAKNGTSSGGTSGSEDLYKGMSPEVAEYFKNR